MCRSEVLRGGLAFIEGRVEFKVAATTVSEGSCPFEHEKTQVCYYFFHPLFSPFDFFRNDDYRCISEKIYVELPKYHFHQSEPLELSRNSVAFLLHSGLCANILQSSRKAGRRQLGLGGYLDMKGYCERKDCTSITGYIEDEVLEANWKMDRVTRRLIHIFKHEDTVTTRETRISNCQSEYQC